jgi:hypothetical protein
LSPFFPNPSYGVSSLAPVGVGSSSLAGASSSASH